MTVIASMLFPMAALVSVLWGRRQLAYKKKEGLHRPLFLLLCSVPFLWGGFHDGVCAAASVVLLGALVYAVAARGSLRVEKSPPALGIALLFLGYLLSPLWAADRGMAWLGAVRMLPVLLFALCVMQLPRGEREELCGAVPLLGAAMTVVSFALRFVPGWEELFTVNHRLAGFFQYPNAYAAFLLAGFVLEARPKKTGVPSGIVLLLLGFGIVESGSRTALVILLADTAVLAFGGERGRKKLLWLLPAAVGGGIALLTDAVGLTASVERIGAVFTGSSTLNGRLLYFKDVLPQILSHPLGQGCGGYYVLQRSFQHGVYSITYIHNELLQLLFDVGWVPGLVFAAGVLWVLFRKRSSFTARLMVFSLAGHSMLDFDLQFLAVWLTVLPFLLPETEKAWELPVGRVRRAAVPGLLAVLCSLWLGAGSTLYVLGNLPACMALVPFHTSALTDTLRSVSDEETVDVLSEKVLRLCPTSAVAHKARGSLALARGDLPAMITEQEAYILNSRYSLSGYCDSLDKLQYSRELYLAVGDTQNAALCLDEMRRVDALRQNTLDTTDPLAYRITEKPNLTLPEAYRDMLEEVE